MPGEHRADRLEVALGRDDDAAGADHRLGDEGGDGVGAFVDDQVLELVGEAGREVALALAVLGALPEVRGGGVAHDLDRQVEVAVVVREAGQRGGDDGDAVVALDPADDLLLRRAAEGVVHVPGELDLGVVGLGAARLVEDPGHAAGGELLDLLGELDAGLVAAGGEEVVVGELLHLQARRLDELGVAEAEAAAPEAGEAVDVAAPGLVEDPDALAALDDERAGLPQRDGVGVGMQQRLGVAHLEVGQRPGHRAPAGREVGATLCDRRRERQSAPCRRGSLEGRPAGVTRDIGVGFP